MTDRHSISLGRTVRMLSTFVGCLTFLVLACIPSQAASPELEKAQTLHFNGQFAEAAALGRSLENPTEQAEGFTLACSAELVLGGFILQEDAMVDALHRALEDCAAAIRLDPHNFGARFSYGVALGYESQRVTSIGLAKKSKRVLEKLLADFPDRPLASAALGGWHGEVAKEGFLARVALGASRDKAEALFAAAVTGDGSTDIGLIYEYVRFLAGGDKKERKQALTVGETFLAQQKTLGKPSASDAYLLERAGKIVTALKADNKKQLKDTLKEVPAFRTLKGMKDKPTYIAPDDIIVLAADKDEDEE